MKISQTYHRLRSCKLLRSQRQRIRLDGDLTGIPVSNTSQTYPNAAFGHMDDEIRLGIPGGSGQLWKARRMVAYGYLCAHHPGDTVSCTQAEALSWPPKLAQDCVPRGALNYSASAFRLVEQQMAETKQRRETQEQALQAGQRAAG